MERRLVLSLATFALVGATTFADLNALVPYLPTPTQVAANYQRANDLRAQWDGKVFKAQLTATWIDANHLWYRTDVRGNREYILVDAILGKKGQAFDHAKLAKALSDATKDEVNGKKLFLDRPVFSSDLKSFTFGFAGKRWTANLSTYELSESKDAPPEVGAARPQRGNQRRRVDSESPDGKWIIRTDQGKLQVVPKGGGDALLQSDKAGFNRWVWSPDSKHLVATRLIPGERKQVNLVQSSPTGGGRAVLKTRGYDLPGDKLDVNEVWLFDLDQKAGKAVEANPIEIDFSSAIQWKSDGSTFTYEFTDRGNTRFRVFEIDAKTGAVSTLIDHQPKTFVDQTTKWLHYLKNDDVLWRSEKDGWNRLYYVNRKSKEAKAITTGDWVVRGVDLVDEEKKLIWFQASGTHAGEDPYNLHHFRVSFDGTGLTELTPAKGNHTAVFSPTRAYVVDTYSSIDTPPVHELRRADGSLVCALETADITDLQKAGWMRPEPFVAKARDGKTDIYGVVYRPSQFDPNKTYPIIENIYAGPQDSFVPKSFSFFNGMQSLAELGFIVVQCDGMGTRNRSKAFHDVCWKNLADAGLPDRIAWMKALGAKYPSVDLNRVGVYGTSAGGQNSTGAVLFHPEFYKVAVSSCGCHDNRMDKYWWNEQWMGFPVGKHYGEQSNITNASKLQGKLLLMVGELDTNVPPESTYRLVDALIKSSKEFEFVLLPGLDHTGGGPFGERKRRDFFVKNLLGVEPPPRNVVSKQ